MKLFNFDNRYVTLPHFLYQQVKPTAVTKPEMVIFNYTLAAQLGLAADDVKTWTQIIAGNQLPDHSAPLAQAYAGHQFGHFTMLGDGRAILLGEHITPDKQRFDIQLKGAGRTVYSRGGDGRAALGPMLREYMISETMQILKIPTTRSLGVVATGEQIYRQKPLNGAILMRVASSHLRVGTFQFAANHRDKRLIKALADHAIWRHYPSCQTTKNPYLSLFDAIANRQLELINHWQRVGFVHGVMNTDNVSIVGETLDYGPCAFMDHYHIDTVFSSIDYNRRYSYGNQPFIMGWNLARLAEALVRLVNDDHEAALKQLEQKIKDYTLCYRKRWLETTGQKIGLASVDNEDVALIQSLFKIMQSERFDFTNTFVYLRHLLRPLAGVTANDLLTETQTNSPEFSHWLNRWHSRLSAQPLNRAAVIELMESQNPLLIARNHQVEAALTAADNGDIKPTNQLLTALETHYNNAAAVLDYIRLSHFSDNYVTYCGT